MKTLLNSVAVLGLAASLFAAPQTPQPAKQGTDQAAPGQAPATAQSGTKSGGKKHRKDQSTQTSRKGKRRHSTGTAGK